MVRPRLCRFIWHVVAGLLPGMVAMNSPAIPKASSVHEERARELLSALDRIHSLEGQLIEARQPRNWDTNDMLIQLQMMLAQGVEIHIGCGRLLILDGEAHYQVQNGEELQQTMNSIQYLKQRKVS
jgi:hypothetical protein